MTPAPNLSYQIIYLSILSIQIGLVTAMEFLSSIDPSIYHSYLSSQSIYLSIIIQEKERGATWFSSIFPSPPPNSLYLLYLDQQNRKQTVLFLLLMLAALSTLADVNFSFFSYRELFMSCMYCNSAA